MGLHKNIAGEDLHVAHAWEYADETAREAATGFIAADVGKLALQLSPRGLWALLTHNPIRWSRVSERLGAEFLSATSNPPSQTTSDSWQEKLKLTTPSLPAGDYLLLWYCELAAGASATPSLRVQVDDTTDIYSEEGLTLPSNGGIWYPYSGFASAEGLTEGVHTVDIDFHSNNPNQVGIQRARLGVLQTKES
jgi:hypothetical protein